MIELQNVTKYYGDFPAVTDISFTVERGERVGFLGPNGAGKSTTMKIVTGFMPPSEGKVTVAGYDIVSQSLEARRCIGYLPETVPLYTDMFVDEYLRFMGTIRGMPRNRISRRIDDVISICGLEEYRSAIIGKLSKGFRQRLGIAQAILHEPEVLILDEPTIGIDPIQVVETRELIRGLGGDHTLIVSTHILPEVSTICERVIIIHEGEIVAVDTPGELGTRLRGGERIEVEVRGPRREVTQALRRVEGVRSVARVAGDESGVSSYAADVDPGADVAPRIASSVIRAGWDLRRLDSVTMSLEEIFLRLTTDEEASAE